MMTTLIPMLLIGLTPVITNLVKKLNAKINKAAPNLPKWSIPLIAVGAGFLLTLLGAATSLYAGNIWLGFLFGLGGIGIREVFHNMNQNPTFRKYTRFWESEE